MRISDWSSDVCSSDLLVEALRAIARRHDQALVPQAGIVEPALQAGQVQSGDVAVGHHDDAVASQHRSHQLARLGPDGGADDDVVAALAERDAEGLRGLHWTALRRPPAGSRA